MQKNTIIVSAITSVLIVVCGILADRMWFAPRLAYVETSKILENFNEAIVARKQLTAEKDSLQKQVKAVQDSLQRVAQVIGANYERAPEKQKALMQADITRMNTEFTTTVNTLQQRVNTREQELMAPVLLKLNDFLQSWGHDHHYSLILGTLSGGNIVAADHALDMTLDVLRDLNKKYQ
jgi:outer membrane protein